MKKKNIKNILIKIFIKNILNKSLKLTIKKLSFDNYWYIIIFLKLYKNIIICKYSCYGGWPRLRKQMHIHACICTCMCASTYECAYSQNK